MTEIRVEPEDLRQASKSLHVTYVDIGSYDSRGPQVLAEGTTGYAQLTEAMEKFRRHWLRNTDETYKNTESLLRLLNGAADGYEGTDSAVGSAGG